jgi:Ino eighty subunit 1
MDASNPTTTQEGNSGSPSVQPAAEPDTRNSLRHILADEPDANAASPVPEPEQEAPSTPKPTQTQAQPTPSAPASASAPASTPQPPPAQPTLQPRIKEEAAATTPGPNSPLPTTPAGASGSETKPMYTATTTTTRRNANGSVSSVYSGNKIRHLKKEDGVPLWRKDIQFDFLKYVFEDDQKVFHKVSDKSYGHTFADIYLDAMAKSSKCSKILKDKLLTERPAALNMAMVCLLVNVGRMNTTLNCELPSSLVSENRMAV